MKVFISKNYLGLVPLGLTTISTLYSLSPCMAHAGIDAKEKHHRH